MIKWKLSISSAYSIFPTESIKLFYKKVSKCWRDFENKVMVTKLYKIPKIIKQDTQEKQKCYGHKKFTKGNNYNSIDPLTLSFSVAADSHENEHLCKNILRFLIILIKIGMKKYRSAHKAHFLSIYNLVTLKIRSRSPKSNNFSPILMMYLLVRSNSINWLKEITCTQTFYCINKAHVFEYL